jgi:flavin-dependent dehydrogenase
MPTQCDVLIIGAGPAGSVAGSILAQKGRKVLCLEGGTFPRFVIGESLLPRCNDILEEAGMLEAVSTWGFMPKPAAKFLKGDSTERFCFAEMFPGQRPAAMQVTRMDFDQLLATEARKKGTEVRFQQRVDAVEPNADGTRQTTKVTDVETGETYTVESKFVLDCSGYGRVLPRLFKLEKDPTLSQKVAVFSHFEGDERPEGPDGGDIWVCIHPNGAWIWIIPFSNGRTSVGVVAEPSIIEPAGKTDHERLKNLLAGDPNAMKRLSKAVPVMKTQRLQSWSAAVTKFHGPGWALTGNASEFLDPVFSSGVTLALESSHRAAKLVDRQLAGEQVDWDKDYAKVMDRAVGVFRVFVEAWYSTELQRVMLFPKKADRIKRAITSVLGGYVLDEQNPFVRDTRGTLEACLKLIA